jgi:PD-(D/E)XK nuclease superfamily
MRSVMGSEPGVGKPQVDVKRLLEQVSTATWAGARARAVYQDRLAPDFSPFQFINHDEVGLSRVIAWLLNRNGSHGQGATFLQLFVERFHLIWSRQMCEVASTPGLEVDASINGRMDILIRSGNAEIVIENKPYASDQQDQLARYFTYLDGQRLDMQAIVYLTASGTRPSEGSIPKKEIDARLASKQLKFLGYSNDIPGWLDECRARCRADRVAIFIDQFIQLIRKTFQGVDNVSDQSQYIEEMLASPAAAMAVIIAKDAFQKKLLEKLKGDLQADMPVEWTFEWSVDASKGQTGFQFDFSEACKVVFRIEFQKLNYGGANYGLKSKQPRIMREEDARLFSNAMKESSIGGKKWGGSWWPWYGAGLEDAFLPVEREWSVSSQPWLAIDSGEFAKQVKDAAKKVFEVLKNKQLLGSPAIPGEVETEILLD